jgi:hypothetical protein
MNHYKFGKVTCSSGASKDFECYANSFREARALLIQFIKDN